MTRSLFVGGVRSGKSALSQRYAESLGKNCLYVATASSALAMHDNELQSRITAHQQQRHAQQHIQWRTCECPNLDFSTISLEDTDVVLIDCLGLWLGHCLYQAEQQSLASDQRHKSIEHSLETFLAHIQACPLPLIMVTSEVGLGMVPMHAQSREFCDWLGLVNQRVAHLCENVILVSCGLPLALKGVLPYFSEK